MFSGEAVTDFLITSRRCQTTTTRRFFHISYRLISTTSFSVPHSLHSQTSQATARPCSYPPSRYPPLHHDIFTSPSGSVSVRLSSKKRFNSLLPFFLSPFSHRSSYPGFVLRPTTTNAQRFSPWPRKAKNSRSNRSKATIPLVNPVLLLYTDLLRVPSSLDQRYSPDTSPLSPHRDEAKPFFQAVHTPSFLPRPLLFVTLLPLHVVLFF